MLQDGEHAFASNSSWNWGCGFRWVRDELPRCRAGQVWQLRSLLRSRDDVVLALSSGPVCTFEQELCADSTLVSYFKETGSYCAKSLRRCAFCVTKFGQVVYAALAWATLSRRTSHQRRWVHVRLQSGALRLVCLCTRAWHLLVLQLWPATYTLRKSSRLSSSGETLFCGTRRRNRRSLPSIRDACREAFMRRRLTFWWSVLLDCVEFAFWRDGIPGAPERLLAGTSSLS